MGCSWRRKAYTAPLPRRIGLVRLALGTKPFGTRGIGWKEAALTWALRVLHPVQPAACASSARRCRPAPRARCGIHRRRGEDRGSPSMAGAGRPSEDRRRGHERSETARRARSLPTDHAGCCRPKRSRIGRAARRRWARCRANTRPRCSACAQFQLHRRHAAILGGCVPQKPHAEPVGLIAHSDQQAGHLILRDGRGGPNPPPE